MTTTALYSPPKLDELLAHCHQRRYPTRTDLMRPGDDAQTLYYILEGSVSVIIEDDEGQEIILDYLNKGDFIGEISLFLDQPKRNVLVRTRSPCLLAEIGYTRLHQLLVGPLSNAHQELLIAIGLQLSHRLVRTSRKVGHLAFYDVTGRIARTLLDLCQQPDAMTHPDGHQIRITRQELGQIVGCSREMAGRVLKRLEHEQLISVRGKTIVVFGTR